MVPLFRALRLASGFPNTLTKARGQGRAFSSKVFEHHLSPSQFEYHKCPEIDLKVIKTKEELLEAYKPLW